MEVQDIEENQMVQITDAIFTISGSTDSHNLKMEIEESESKCFICNCELQEDVFVKIYGTVLPKVGILLCNSVKKFLKTSHVSSDILENAILCSICFNLFDELESAEEHCSKLRNRLLSAYKETSHLLGRLVETSNTVACQTDLVQDLPISIKEEEITVKPKTRSAKKVKTKFKRKQRKSIQSQKTVSESSDNDEKDTDIANVNQIERLHSDADSDIKTLEPTQTKKKYIRKKHKCEQCPRLFRRPGELKNHLLVSHVGSNPNQCVYCQKKFNSRNGLYVHLKKIHRMQYSDRMELVAILNEEAGLDNATSPKLLTRSTSKRRRVTSNAESSGLSDGEGIEEGADSSGSEWTEETDTSKRRKPCFARSRKQGSGDGGKENRRSNSAGGKRVLRAKYLSEHGIGEDVFVKGEDNVDEEVTVKEEEEGGGRKGVKEEEGEGGKSESEGKKRETRRKKPRSRVGERACMPLIHACPTCGKKWRTVSELNAHVQTHSDLRPFVCEICGQGYKMRKALLVHVGMHNGIHPFTCHYCNKSFTQKIGLVKHINIHQGTKKYQCDLCGKSFIHYTSYSFHKLVHTGQRLAKCSICDLALLSKSHLTRHMLVHTGEKPHECDVCGKRFAKKWNLNVHRKKLHGVDMASSRLQLIDSDRVEAENNSRETVERDPTPAKIPRVESATEKIHAHPVGRSHLDGEFLRSDVADSGKLLGTVGQPAHVDGLSAIGGGNGEKLPDTVTGRGLLEGEFAANDVGEKLHGIATGGRSSHLLGELSGVHAGLQVAPPPAPLMLVQKCTLCPFTSSRKQALQEHWERDHSRFLNTYPQEYEEYAM